MGTSVDLFRIILNRKSRRSKELKTMENVYLTPDELAARYRNKISVRTLANWRSRGDGPKFLRTGGRILYPLAHVLAWEDQRTVESTNQYGARRA